MVLEECYVYWCTFTCTLYIVTIGLLTVMSLHFLCLTYLHKYTCMCADFKCGDNKHIMYSGYVHVYSVCVWYLICVYLLLYLCVTTLVDLCSTNSIRISVEEDSDDGRWSPILSHRLHHFNACLRLTILSVPCIYLFLICLYKKKTSSLFICNFLCLQPSISHSHCGTKTDSFFRGSDR